MIPLSPEAEWLAVLQGVPQWVPPMRPTVVIAPHPDDETLGAGGLIATQRRRGVPVIVVAVTNGEAAYPGACGLGEVRRAEQQLAVAELGVDCTEVSSMHLPDGNVVAFEEALTDLVSLYTTAPPGSDRRSSNRARALKASCATLLRRWWPETASLALFIAFGQFLLNDQQQSLVFQGLIGVAHPRLPKILHGLGDQAIGKSAL